MRNLLIGGAFAALLFAQPAIAQKGTRDHALAKADKKFSRFDKDNNGKLDSTEITAMFQARATHAGKTMKPKAVKRFIHKNDTDSDGVVTREEFKLATGARFDRRNAAKAGAAGSSPANSTAS